MSSENSNRLRLNCLTLLAVVLVQATIASAQIARVRALRRNGNGTVSFPYQASDGHGDTWMVYQPSMIQMQGNFPVYQQAGAITIAGTQPNPTNQARMDDKNR